MDNVSSSSSVAAASPSIFIVASDGTRFEIPEQAAAFSSLLKGALDRWNRDHAPPPPEDSDDDDDSNDDDDNTSTSSSSSTSTDATADTVADGESTPDRLDDDSAAYANGHLAGGLALPGGPGNRGLLPLNGSGGRGPGGGGGGSSDTSPDAADRVHLARVRRMVSVGASSGDEESDDEDEDNGHKQEGTTTAAATAAAGGDGLSVPLGEVLESADSDSDRTASVIEVDSRGASYGNSVGSPSPQKGSRPPTSTAAVVDTTTMTIVTAADGDGDGEAGDDAATASSSAVFTMLRTESGALFGRDGDEDVEVAPLTAALLRQNASGRGSGNGGDGGSPDPNPQQLPGVGAGGNSRADSKAGTPHVIDRDTATPSTLDEADEDEAHGFGGEGSDGGMGPWSGGGGVNGTMAATSGGRPSGPGVGGSRPGRAVRSRSGSGAALPAVASPSPGGTSSGRPTNDPDDDDATPEDLSLAPPEGADDETAATAAAPAAASKGGKKKVVPGKKSKLPAVSPAVSPAEGPPTPDGAPRKKAVAKKAGGKAAPAKGVKKRGSKSPSVTTPASGDDDDRGSSGSSSNNSSATPSPKALSTDSHRSSHADPSGSGGPLLGGSGNFELGASLAAAAAAGSAATGAKAGGGGHSGTTVVADGNGNGNDDDDDGLLEAAIAAVQGSSAEGGNGGGGGTAEWISPASVHQRTPVVLDDGDDVFIVCGNGHEETLHSFGRQPSPTPAAPLPPLSLLPATATAAVTETKSSRERGKGGQSTGGHALSPASEDDTNSNSHSPLLDAAAAHGELRGAKISATEICIDLRAASDEDAAGNGSSATATTTASTAAAGKAGGAKAVTCGKKGSGGAALKASAATTHTCVNYLLHFARANMDLASQGGGASHTPSRHTASGLVDDDRASEVGSEAGSVASISVGGGGSKSGDDRPAALPSPLPHPLVALLSPWERSFLYQTILCYEETILDPLLAVLRHSPAVSYTAPGALLSDDKARKLLLVPPPPAKGVAALRQVMEAARDLRIESLYALCCAWMADHMTRISYGAADNFEAAHLIRQAFRVQSDWSRKETDCLKVENEWPANEEEY